MRKIYISAGHSNVASSDRGAASGKFIEGELTVELRDLIVAELRLLGIEPVTDPNKNALSETLRLFRNLTTSKCIVFDIHWNAASPAATGVETLIPAQFSNFELQLANAISEVTSTTLGLRKRGSTNNRLGVKTELASHHGSLGWMRLTGENVLLEVCFITNANDMKAYNMYKKNLAKEIARVLAEYSKK